MQFSWKGKTIKMRAQIGSSARCGNLLWLFDDHIIASYWFQMKSKSSVSRFSTSLARTSRCAYLQQNRRQDPTNLFRRCRSLLCIPGLIVCLTQRSYQTQLIDHNAYPHTPAFKLCGSVVLVIQALRMNEKRI